MITESANDKFLQEDLEKLTNDMQTPIEEISNADFIITGATGLVGSQIVKSLAALNRLKNANIRIYALVRNTNKAEQIYNDLLSRDDIKMVVADLNDREMLFSSVKENVKKEDNRKLFLIHTAAVTVSKMMVEKPVETIETAINGTKNILDLCLEQGVSSCVYLSSMEVYGKFENGEYVTEDKMGYVDPLAVRSNYPLSKRMCENLCVSYASEYGLDIKIARLAQTFGAGILKGENRVFAQFAKSVLEQKDIVLHTKGLSEGNYAYTIDTVRALLIILTKGKSKEAYNICNESAHTSIADMAQFVADKLSNGTIKVTFDIPKENTYGYAADTKMKLSSQKLRELGWSPEYSLEDAYTRMMGSMKSWN